MSPKCPSDVEKIAVLKQRVSTLTHLAKVQRRLLQDAERRADHWREEAEEAREALEAIAAELSEVEETEEPSDNGPVDEGLGQDHDLVLDAEESVLGGGRTLGENPKKMITLLRVRRSWPAG